jgi:methylmalonyl-CoA/ethylmalonyl-CoA epimerase
VGIIVPDLERVRALMSLLGLEPGASEYVPEYEADCFFTCGAGSALEFIVPRGGKLALYNKGVGGLHHIALEVENLQEFSTQLRAQGVDLLEERPVDAGRLWINFLPPAYTRGLIVEFVESKKVTTARESDHHGRDLDQGD